MALELEVAQGTDSHYADIRGLDPELCPLEWQYAAVGECCTACYAWV